MYLYIRICVFLLSTGFLCCHAQKVVDCSENALKNFDKTVARLITIANSGRSFPEATGPELNKYCKDTEKLLKDIEKYKSACTKDLSKQMVGVVIYSIKNAVKQFCTKSSKRLDTLLAATPCFNKNDKLVTKCYSKMIDGFIGTKRVDEKKKIPHLCCEYGDFFPCLEKELTSAPKCGEKNVETLSDFIRTLMGDAVNLLCGDFTEGSDRCEKLGPPPKKLKTERRSKSFAIPVLNLLSSLPEI